MVFLLENKSFKKHLNIVVFWAQLNCLLPIDSLNYLKNSSRDRKAERDSKM